MSESGTVVLDKPEHINVLDDGGVAVVVGGRTTNFDLYYRKMACFVFWDSTDPDSNKKDLPSNSRAVILTRFCSHALSNKLAAQARARNILIYWPQNTGEIKRIMDRLIPRIEPRVIKPEPTTMQPFTTVVPAPAPAKPTTPPVVPPKPTKEEEPRGAFDRGTRATYTPKVWDEQEVEKRKQELGKGYVQTFLKRYANINCKVLAEEAERLLKIADEQRIPTTLASLGQALRIMRKNAGMPNISGRGEKKVAPAPQPVPMTTAKPTTASTTTEVRYEMSESANETLKLIDDLAAGMTLLREHFIKAEKRVADANRRMKVMHEAIQALKNLDALDK